MQRYPLLRQCIAIFVFLALLIGNTAQAQETAPNGALIHTVQPGETFDAVAINYDLTRDELLALNPDVTNVGLIQIGQRLIVRAGETTPTPTPVPPTPGPSPVELAAPAPIRSSETGDVLPPIDPAVGDASICVSLFEDSNENRIHESNEALLEGGQVRLSGSEASDGTFTPDGQTDPYCFEGLSAGVYTVIAAAPESYGLTTPSQLQVEAVPGVSVQIAFGAARGAVPPARVVNTSNTIVNEAVAPEVHPPTANPLLDNLGLIAFALAGVVLVGGLGVSLLLRRR
jgi:hypothetical protein